MAFKFQTLANADKVLGVAGGGTGLTASPSVLVNLGSTSAASMFAASPRPGATGTLKIANGGTGATTAADARTNLGVNQLSVVSTVLDNKSLTDGYQNVDITITKSGKTAIGVVGYHIVNASTDGNYYGYCSVNGCYLKDANTVRVNVRSYSPIVDFNFTAKVKITVYVLYKA